MSWLNTPLPKVYTAGNGKVIASLDDVPEIASLAKRRTFLMKGYKIFALAPFGMDVFIISRYFPASHSWFAVDSLSLCLAWSIAVATYTFYLTFWLKCPSCNERISSDQKLPLLWSPKT